MPEWPTEGILETISVSRKQNLGRTLGGEQLAAFIQGKPLKSLYAADWYVYLLFFFCFYGNTLLFYHDASVHLTQWLGQD